MRSAQHVENKVAYIPWESLCQEEDRLAPFVIRLFFARISAGASGSTCPYRKFHPTIKYLYLPTRVLAPSVYEPRQFKSNKTPGDEVLGEGQVCRCQEFDGQEILST
jgi:hypothetical protein